MSTSKTSKNNCILCNEIVTPYGGLIRLRDDGVMHMECAMTVAPHNRLNKATIMTTMPTRKEIEEKKK